MNQKHLFRRSDAYEISQLVPVVRRTGRAGRNCGGGRPGAGKDAGSDGWKAEFERSLLEDYGVTPDHYEDLGNGIYQVYVKLDGKVVPYVTVDSATGDYHG